MNAAQNIKDIKVWKSLDGKETRVYIHTFDKREGTRYITGNPWHAPKTNEGNLTDEEWKVARAMSVDETGHWRTCYFDAPVASNGRCPDCGGPIARCAINCVVNR